MSTSPRGVGVLKIPGRREKFVLIVKDKRCHRSYNRNEYDSWVINNLNRLITPVLIVYHRLPKVNRSLPRVVSVRRGEVGSVFGTCGCGVSEDDLTTV